MSQSMSSFFDGAVKLIAEGTVTRVEGEVAWLMQTPTDTPTSRHTDRVWHATAYSMGTPGNIRIDLKES